MCHQEPSNILNPCTNTQTRVHDEDTPSLILDTDSDDSFFYTYDLDQTYYPPTSLTQGNDKDHMLTECKVRQQLKTFPNAMDQLYFEMSTNDIQCVPTNCLEIKQLLWSLNS